jgi:galactose-1-phosphate uridylyltransferase
LIFFPGCPNYPTAKKALAEIFPNDYEEVNQDDLDGTSEYKQYSSPTIICDGEVVIGYKSGDSSCTLLNMTLEEMKEYIQKAKEGA